jgi:predicted ATPase
MRIIEKIKISKFRSIRELETIESYDLNIFSGSNDSGKSNFLKAINLFFNGQTDINIRYDSESDFNKWFRDNNVRGQRIIEIAVYICPGNYGDKEGINKGFIAKKVFRIDGGYDTFFHTKDDLEIKQNELSHRKASAVINERIRYIYIPTVRDIKFRESIQRLIQEIANSTDKRFKSQDLKEAFEKMEIGIDNQLKDLTSYVKDKMNIDVETNVNFSTLLESLTFETSEKIKIKKRKKIELEIQKVSLKNRGEGIQMQFFSFMLWFISKNDTKHFYIWGYEEPEIAFEFKRQFELADIFQNTFSKVAQIFLTTHSPAFAFIESSSLTKVFRVNYEKEKNTKSGRHLSRVIPINEYYEGLFRELTIVSAENKKSLERDIWGINAQKISKMIGESMEEIIGVREISKTQLDELKLLISEQQNHNNLLENKIIHVENELKNIFPENIFICEDEKAINLWGNLLFEKLGISRSKFKIISSKGCTNNEVEIAVLHLMKTKVGYQPKIFRQLDRDGYTNNQIEFLESAKIKNSDYSKFKKYIVKFLPVNEIENFAILLDTYFTIEKLQEFNMNNKISDAFRQTTNANIITAQKLCKDDTEKSLFRSKEAFMIQEARTDLLRFFPGKEIKKTKRNFNCDNVLISKTLQELPLELRDYLNLIKDFYEN